MSDSALLRHPATGSESRNAYVDWARALSVCVVVVFHTRLFYVNVVDGALELQMWAPPSFLWIITWPLMVIPMFFIAGGYGHSVNVAKSVRLGLSYGEFLANRARRLAGPTMVFIGIWAFLASVAAAVFGPDGVAELCRAGMNLLWFITVYLGVTLAAPIMVRLHDQFGVWVFVTLAVVALSIDAWATTLGHVEIRNLNMAPVWLFAHKLGIAYHRGWFRTWPTALLGITVVAGCAVIAVLVFGLGYAPVSVGFGDIPIGNVQPPTFAMSVLGVVQAALLAVFEKMAPRWATNPVLHRAVSVVNSLLMTIYLWHMPCIVAVNIIMWASGLAAGLPGWGFHWMTTLASVALTALVAPLIARIDMTFIPELQEIPTTRRIVWATIILMAGVAAVWRFGLVVHPSQPWSSLAVAAVVFGWIKIRSATGKKGTPVSSQGHM